MKRRRKFALVNGRDEGRALNPGTPQIQALERRLSGQRVPANKVERYLVSSVPQLLDYCPLGRILRLERADAVELLGENTPHSERFCVQETELDAVIQS